MLLKQKRRKQGYEEKGGKKNAAEKQTSGCHLLRLTLEKERPCFRVGGNTLEKGQGIAHPV